MENTISTPETPVTPVSTAKARVAKAKVEVQGNVLTFAFANGVSRIVNTGELPADITARAIVHGIEQKLRDCYAGAESPDQAVGYFDKVLDSLKANQWNIKGEGKSEEDSIDRLVTALFNALIANGKDEATARTKSESVRTMDKTQRAKVRSIPAVAVELAKLKTSTMSLDEI